MDEKRAREQAAAMKRVHSRAWHAVRDPALKAGKFTPEVAAKARLAAKEAVDAWKAKNP